MGKKFVFSGSTMADLYSPIVNIKDKEEARDYLESLVWHKINNLRDTRSYDDIMKAERSNVGYYAAYFDRETTARVFELFETSHPVFGTRLDLSAEALIRLGMEYVTRTLEAKHQPVFTPL